MLRICCLALLVVAANPAALHCPQLDKAVYSSIQTAFSAQTNANQVQDIIDLKLDKRRKGVYGPPHNIKVRGRLRAF
jgi:hypothetical protein